MSKLWIVGGLAALGMVGVGGWYGVRHSLQPAAPSVVAIPAPPGKAPSTLVRAGEPENVKRLRIEAESQKAVSADLEQRLRDAIQGWSAAEIQRAKVDGRYPRDTVVRPGTSLVTAMNVDTVWVRGNDGDPKPYKIGQVVPSAGKLLAIDAAKGEAIAERTYLRITDPVKPGSPRVPPSADPVKQ